MVSRGCSMLRQLGVLVVLAAGALAAPPPPGLQSGLQYGLQYGLQAAPAPASGLTLAELAAARALTPPSPRDTRPAGEKAKEVEAQPLGARHYPLGLADPLPPARSSARWPSRGALLAGDDVYETDKLPTNVVPTRYTVRASCYLPRPARLNSTKKNL